MCMELVRSVATFHRAAYCTVGAVQCWWLGGTPSGQRGRPLLCWGAGGRPGQWRSFGGSSRPGQTTGHRPRHRCAAARRPARQWTVPPWRKDVVNQCLEFVPVAHSVHRFPAPSSKEDVVNQCLVFVPVAHSKPLGYDILPLEEGAGKRCSECVPVGHCLQWAR